MGRKTILLTGASGFIGRNLAERLAAKHELLTPTRSELDLADAAKVEQFLASAKPDIVLHAASEGVSRSQASPASFEKSLKMFMNIAKCGRHFGRMIQVGSGAEYGKGRPLVKVNEAEFGKAVPGDGYGRYKYECSKYIEGAEGITCLRLFGCYGKYEDWQTRFISNAVCRALFNLPIAITNRNVVFSYLYVDDFCAVAEKFIEKEGKHKFYNVTPDETVDLLSIAKLVLEISGKELPITVNNPGRGNEYSGDNSRLTEELPGFRFTPLSEGVRCLYSWYGKNLSLVDREKLASGKY